MEIPPYVVDILSRAIEEDVGFGDITSRLLIPEESKSKAIFIAKEDFIIAGIPFAEKIFSLIDSSILFNYTLKDGARVKSGDTIAEIYGKTRSILLGERVSLNILQRLSGVATLTSMFVEKVKGTKAKIVDTRKTTPCLRVIEKYAVKIGGGENHRFGLYDGILIKDNHIKAVGSISKAIELAKRGHHLSKIEIEVKNISELLEAMNAGADVVMLDNMSVEEMKEAVKISEGKIMLEASGGVTLESVKEIAETGVDFISIGAITHSFKASDISLKIIP